MKIIKPLKKQRAIIIGGFVALGFRNRTAFYNVCKSLDCTLNGFEVLEFYEGSRVNPNILGKLESILQMLKNE